MEWLLLIALVIIVVMYVLILNRKRIETGDSTYEKHDVLFTPAERSFYGVLCDACKDKAIVFGKVRVADVLKTKKGLNPSNRLKAFNRISSKHFDFILCHPDTLEVLMAVELDDSSHNSKKRIKRDEFLNDACQSASFNLIHFKASSGYSITEVRDTLFPKQIIDDVVSASNEEIEPNFNKPKLAVEPTLEPQNCPKCSSELIRKVAKKGKHKGSYFLACSAFPKCRHIEKQKA
jgi:ssDNA-binding Zn-finger/Zn-ribbon topoisomerase 1